MPRDQELFRQAWAKFTTGVAVITSLEEDGYTIHGMTANAVCSVALEPPLALVCVGHQRNTYRYIRRWGRFGINVLGREQEAIARYYTRKPEDRVGDVATSFQRTRQGGAVISDCLASMDCRVVAAHEAGDHTIFIGEAEEIRVRDGEPLVFFNGAFTLTQAP